MPLTIEKLIYGGDGLAHLPADQHGRGKAVFIPFTLPSEQVEAKLIEQKPGFARAALEAVVTPSPNRIVPHCPYFARCGGCHYQHTTYEEQLRFKAEILRENLKRLAKFDLPIDLQIHASPPWEYRNRSRFQLRTTPEFTLGYYRFSSHDVLPIDQCPISSPLINRTLARIQDFGCRVSPPSTITEIEIFADASDSHLLMELFTQPGSSIKELRPWLEQLQQAVPESVGLTLFTSQTRSSSNQEANPNPAITLNSQRLEYKTVAFTYRVSAGAFFQINRHMVDQLVEIVTRDRFGETALDLYAGAGLFTLPLARSFRHIQAVESSPLSCNDLLYNAPGNVKAVRATTESFLSRASQTPAPDLVVVDPPRAGLREASSRLLAQWQPRRITYVSCDPATLARDLVPLLAAGYRIEQAHLVDLFPQTYHLETVLHLALA